MRWIGVVGDADQSLAVLPGGQSGHPFDPHYDDQLELYLEGRLRSLAWRQPTIADSTVAEMRFEP
jgi:penicillin amidase